MGSFEFLRHFTIEEKLLVPKYQIAISTKMKFSLLASLLLLPIISTQEVKFGSSGDSQDTQAKVERGETIDTKNGEITEEDVNERFIDINLGEFGNNVAASALGTVIGNVGTNLAGNFLNGCNNRGKRSIYVSSNDMHKMRKRQAVNLEADEKSEDPEVKSKLNQEVAERFLPCPQQFLNPGGSNNNRYCDRCYCSDWDCRRDCRKCSHNNGPNNWSSGSSNNNGWSSSSNNNGWSSGSTSSSLNCRTCSCRYSSCKNGCSKCYSSNNNHNSYPSSSGNSWPSSSSSNVNCDTCNCSYSSCRNDCARCHFNTNNNNGWSGNSGSNYNNGWRSGVNGRNGEDSEGSEVVVEQSSTQQKESGDGEVVFA